MAQFILVFGNPLVAFDPELGALGYGLSIPSLVVMVSGFIEKKIIRRTLAISATAVWLIPLLISHFGLYIAYHYG